MTIKTFRCYSCDPGCQKEAEGLSIIERKTCTRGTMMQANFVKVT